MTVRLRNLKDRAQWRKHFFENTRSSVLFTRTSPGVSGGMRGEFGYQANTLAGEASVEWKLQFHKRVQRRNQGTDGRVCSSEILDSCQVGQHISEAARMAEEVAESKQENVVIHFWTPLQPLQGWS